VSDAEALATEALTAAERCGDAELTARASFARGVARAVVGSHSAAHADLTAAIEQARAAGDRRLEMAVLRALGGDVTVSVGRPGAEGDANFERGLRIAQSLGDRASEAEFLGLMSVVAANRLRYDLALDYGLRAVKAGRAAKDDQALAAGLDGLKTVYWGLGDVHALRIVVDEMSPLVRRLGDLFRLQWVEFELAFPYVAAADWDGAARAMQAGIDANRRAGYPHHAIWYVAHMGWLARLRGRDQEALDHGRQAIALSERHPHTFWHAAACALLGDTLLVTGDRGAAIDVLERGLAVAERSGVESYALRCAAPLAAATGSRTMLTKAAGLLDAAVLPDGGAWVQGDECYLSVARAWLAHDEPDRARAVLAPLLAVAQRVPWIPTLAAALAVDGQALIRLDQAEAAQKALRTSAELASRHGLPHILAEATAARRKLS
jgi:tetratricopeptide (TPR) repeat protein